MQFVWLYESLQDLQRGLMDLARDSRSSRNSGFGNSTYGEGPAYRG